MPEIYGIDVSKYQGEIDYKKVKGAGKDFVFVRLGWAGWDGALNFDSMAEANIKSAKQAGLSVGLYVYSYCRTQDSARTAARQTLDFAKHYEPIEYPIAFDIEDTSQSGTPYQTYGKKLNSSIAAAFLEEIENSGYYGILYTYKSFAESYLDMTSLNRYDVWIAQYATKCGYTGSYGIWQYAGESGRCDGVKTACDLNIAYKDYAGIIKAMGLNGFPKSQTQPTQPNTQSDSDAVKAENNQLKETIEQLNGKLKKIKELAS